MRLADLPLASHPHHDGSPLYVSTETPVLGGTVWVRLRVPTSFPTVRSVRTRSNPDHEPRFSDAAVVFSDADAAWWQAPVEVENPVHGYRWLIELADGSILWLNAVGLSAIEVRDVDDFRLVTAPPPPAWARDQVMYQVFPDRFARSEQASERPLPDWAEPAQWTDPVDPDRAHTAAQFYGGDLLGIQEHLDHLVDLGVTLLYLTPVFPARSNHRYDALSFDHVDPLLGGDDALAALVQAAHARGIRVIGDLTTNHSGDAHEWFRAAYGHPGAAESDFYLWLNAEQTQYVSWMGVPSLPKFDWRSPELRTRFIQGPGSVVAKWLQPPYALDGWRIDVSNMTGRYRDLDLNQEVRETIRRTMEEVNADTILLGESTNDAAPDFPGDAWHGAMTYANFTRPLWNWLGIPQSPAGGGLGMAFGRTGSYGGKEFVAAHRASAAAFPWRVRLQNMNALDTHDTPRFSTVARPGTIAAAFGLSVTLPGIPVIWAGAELGLGGADGEESRQPIPWGTFSSNDEPLATYRVLVALRRAHPALNRGGLRWLHASDDAVAFVREGAEERVLVVAAREACSFELGVPMDGAGLALVLHTGVAVEKPSGAGSTVAHDGGRVSFAGPGFAAWTLPAVTLPAWPE